MRVRTPAKPPLLAVVTFPDHTRLAASMEEALAPPVTTSSSDPHSRAGRTPPLAPPPPADTMVSPGPRTGVAPSLPKGGKGGSPVDAATRCSTLAGEGGVKAPKKAAVRAKRGRSKGWR